MHRPAVLIALLVLAALLAAPARALDPQSFEARLRADEAAAAIEEAKAALKERPEDLDLSRALQDALLALGRAAEAGAVVDAAGGPVGSYLRARRQHGAAAAAALDRFAEDPRFARWLELDRARILRDLGEHRDAEKALRAHRKTNPECLEGMVFEARLDLDKGSSFSARRTLEQALERDPHRPTAVALLAEALWDPRKPEEARQVLDAALATYPRSPALRLALADHHLRRGDVEDAIPLVEALAASRPDDAEVLSRWALVLRSAGRLDEAEKVAHHLLELDPEAPRGHLTLGFILEKKGDLAGALDRYLEAVRLAGDRIEPFVSAAFVQMMMKDYENAGRTLELAFKIDDDHLGALRVAGLLAFFEGDNREARNHLKRVLKEWPDDVASLRAMGYVLLDDGRIKDALETFEHLLEVQPRDAGATRMIGRGLLENGKVEDALAALEKALSYDEKDPWIHFDLGTALEAKGEFDAAKEAHLKAIELDKAFAWPHLSLAEILDEVDGDLIGALSHYQRFLDLGGPDPDHEIAQRVSAIKNQ